jgi:hypothetical protein
MAEVCTRRDPDKDAEFNNENDQYSPSPPGRQVLLRCEFCFRHGKKSGYSLSNFEQIIKKDKLWTYLTNIPFRLIQEISFRSIQEISFRSIQEVSFRLIQEVTDM